MTLVEQIKKQKEVQATSQPYIYISAIVRYGIPGKVAIPVREI